MVIFCFNKCETRDVILVELIPESTENNKLNTIGFLIGFAIMMILDIALA